MKDFYFRLLIRVEIKLTLFSFWLAKLKAEGEVLLIAFFINDIHCNGLPRRNQMEI